MTPMIDVVFLILIYFIATFEPISVMAELEAATPITDDVVLHEPKQPPLIHIDVFADQYRINGKIVAAPELDRLLNKLGASDPTQLVLVSPSQDSAHSRLVEVLDLCAKSELNKLSIVIRK